MSKVITTRLIFKSGRNNFRPDFFEMSLVALPLDQTFKTGCDNFRPDLNHV